MAAAMFAPVNNTLRMAWLMFHCVCLWNINIVEQKHLNKLVTEEDTEEEESVHGICIISNKVIKWDEQTCTISHLPVQNADLPPVSLFTR